MIESSQGDSERSQTIGGRFALASLYDSGSEIGEINHFDLLGEVWILKVEICSGGLSEGVPLGFLLEIDVAVESTDSLGLIGSLGEARGPGERVGADRCAHVVVLSIQSVGPMRDWLLLSIISLWDSLPEFFVRALLKSSPGSVLDDQLFITLIHTHVCAILSDHNSSADHILSVTFAVVRRPCGGLEISLFFFQVASFILLLQFSHHLHSDLHFSKSYNLLIIVETYLLFGLLGLSADLGKVVSWVVALADLSLHLRDEWSWLISVSVDTTGSIVENLISCDGVFEI